MEKLELKAPAKINLNLEVLRKREDGFHDIHSVFSIIDLCDTLTFERNDKMIKLIENDPIKDNIVLKAANLLKDLYSVQQGVSIKLNKVIPDQKGLGGGSSDAATTLIGLNKFWDLKISKEVLLEIAIQLGSDVPFFIYGKTAVAEGRGEILTEHPYKERFFLLQFPELKVSTKLAFEEGEISFVKKQGEKKSNFNSFEKWIKQNYLEMQEIFEKLKDIGNPRLSGTGSTVFVEFDSLDKAILAQRKFPELVLTKSLERSPLMQIIE